MTGGTLCSLGGQASGDFLSVTFCLLNCGNASAEICEVVLFNLLDVPCKVACVAWAANGSMRRISQIAALESRTGRHIVSPHSVQIGQVLFVSDNFVCFISIHIPL